MALDIKPTRSELIKLKKKINLAVSGHKLLKKKRDGLILDFFEVLKEAKTVRKELVEVYGDSLDKVNKARIIETDIKIKSIAMAVKERPVVQVETKNIMGVIVPKIKSEPLQKNLMERGYGIIGSSAAIDEAAAGFEKLVEKVIKAAEIETAMKKMLMEIEKTKRRVNALEFVVMPKMEEVKKFITLRLEEMERENIFGLKMIKAKH